MKVESVVAANDLADARYMYAIAFEHAALMAKHGVKEPQFKAYKELIDETAKVIEIGVGVSKLEVARIVLKDRLGN